ncbi:hypothetical protein GH714_020308 [Hevea brasiliensis]|uniref:Uncharacterized protein n=1 Tax=Hevea brasiliensis TaxID=3981 RepID=A0A6A6KRH9_HEVBR|nr:hypothetical protein GH714_020308 [Hevea brasiliensis]
MKCSERGDVARARLCLSKAIRADPNDIALRVLHASLYAKLGDCHRAAESYEQISRVCPEDVEVLKISAKLYAECGQTERSISILENHLKGHPSGADFGVIDLLADLLMETMHIIMLFGILSMLSRFTIRKGNASTIENQSWNLPCSSWNIEKAEVCTSKHC